MVAAGATLQHIQYATRYPDGVTTSLSCNLLLTISLSFPYMRDGCIACHNRSMQLLLQLNRLFSWLVRPTPTSEPDSELHNESRHWHLPRLYVDPGGPPEYIGNFLSGRFEQRGGMSTLHAAIALHRIALKLRSRGHHMRFSSLNNLANTLDTRFEQRGEISDLDEAVSLYRSAIELCQERHEARSTLSINFANTLSVRFKQVGEMADLEEAIALLRNATRFCPEAPFARYALSTNLANALIFRFEHLGMMSDVDEAIAFHRTALGHIPEANALQSTPLSNLAGALVIRFEEVGNIADLDEAITLLSRALNLRPLGHPLRSWTLNNLAGAFKSRFNHLQGRADLENAINLGYDALKLRPEGHPFRFTSLQNLAIALRTRFAMFGLITDLDEAITLYRNALELHQKGHPSRFAAVHGVAFSLLQHPHAPEKRMEEAFTLYSTLTDTLQFVNSEDLAAAQGWVSAAEKVGHHTTLLAYQTLLRLLITHLASLPCLPKHLTILKKHTSSLAMDAFSASIRHGSLTDAVELLEQGRGVFWSQLTRLRSPVDEVIASGGEGKLLGERFLSVSRALRSTLDSNPEADQAWHLTNQLRETVDSIRQVLGHSRFLLPPLFSDLQSAASGGPIVIVNASQYGCDALIVFHERDPVHIPLEIKKARAQELSLELASIVTTGKVQDVQRELVILLRQLWDEVVLPIVQVLEEFCDRRSRIWWCPTAEFSLLPLHAAGEYRTKKPNFSDLYISSYTPTLTALIRSRHPFHSATSKVRFIAVGNGETPGEATLVNVHAELTNIGELVQPNATFTCIEGQDASVSKVGEELQRSDFVHFACHGIPNPALPFESGFALSDGLLKIQDIIRYDLQHTRLATLSACHATVGDKESPDEAIHLAAAIQFIGFRSVIGTMWAVDDEEAKKVMTEFYRVMIDSGSDSELDHTRAAFALHKALRVAKPPIPLFQRILFVHIGA